MCKDNIFNLQFYDFHWFAQEMEINLYELWKNIYLDEKYICFR